MLKIFLKTIENKLNQAETLKLYLMLDLSIFINICLLACSMWTNESPGRRESQHHWERAGRLKKKQQQQKLGWFQHKSLAGEMKGGKKERKKRNKTESLKVISTKPLGFCCMRIYYPKYVWKEAKCSWWWLRDKSNLSGKVEGFYFNVIFTYLLAVTILDKLLKLFEPPWPSL